MILVQEKDPMFATDELIANMTTKDKMSFVCIGFNVVLIKCPRLQEWRDDIVVIMERMI